MLRRSQRRARVQVRTGTGSLLIPGSVDVADLGTGYGEVPLVVRVGKARQPVRAHALSVVNRHLVGRLVSGRPCATAPATACRCQEGRPDYYGGHAPRHPQLPPPQPTAAAFVYLQAGCRTDAWAVGPSAHCRSRPDRMVSSRTIDHWLRGQGVTWFVHSIDDDRLPGRLSSARRRLAEYAARRTRHPPGYVSGRSQGSRLADDAPAGASRYVEWV